MIAQGQTPRRGGGLTLVLPVGVFLLGIAVEFLTILSLNSGHFTYTLDDPYIHLALAQRISEGHYGINPGEPSAPSSSILWPFLLAPATSFPWFEFLPLGIGIVAATATITVYRRVLESAFGGVAPRPANILSSVILSLLVLLTNLIGLTYTGMEHSLQVLLAAMVVLGLVREAESGRVPSWLPWVIAVGPTVRYESLAASVAAVLYLLARGHRRTALLSTVATLVPLGIYSLFLVHAGLNPVPASVLLKAPMFSPSVLGGLLSNVRETLRDPTGVLLAVSGAWMLSIALASTRPVADRKLAGSMTVAVALHALFGRYGAYHRWEMYIVAAGSLTLLYLERRAISRALVKRSGMIGAAFATLWCLILGGRYIFGLATIPVAANNIYEQQYQMHRFIVEYERGPVVVNDLGYTSFGNRNYVLDLMGLGSPGVPTQPRGIARNWVAQAAAEHGIGTAMLYEEWFEDLPRTWRKVGKLHLSRPRITPAWGSVSFYATSDAAYPEVRSRLRAFAATVPAGVRFEFEQ